MLCALQTACCYTDRAQTILLNTALQQGKKRNWTWQEASSKEASSVQPSSPHGLSASPLQLPVRAEPVPAFQKNTCSGLPCRAPPHAHTSQSACTTACCAPPLWRCNAGTVHQIPSIWASQHINTPPHWFQSNWQQTRGAGLTWTCQPLLLWRLRDEKAPANI